MDPELFLWLLVALTLLAGGLQWASIARRRRAMHVMARSWGMTYVHCDRFHLASRVGPLLPGEGAVDVVVSDVMYQTAGTNRRYIFTVDFAQGHAAKQRTQRRVAAAEEAIGSPAIELRVGDGGLEEYHRLRAAWK